MKDQEGAFLDGRGIAIIGRLMSIPDKLIPWIYVKTSSEEIVKIFNLKSHPSQNKMEETCSKQSSST